VTTDARETAAQGIGTVDSHGYTALSPAEMSALLPPDQLWVRLQSHDRVIHDNSIFTQAEARGAFSTGSLRHSLLVGTDVGHHDYRNQNYARLQRRGSSRGL
jgi:catecholate siderophore receptor